MAEKTQRLSSTNIIVLSNGERIITQMLQDMADAEPELLQRMAHLGVHLFVLRPLMLDSFLNYVYGPRYGFDNLSKISRWINGLDNTVTTPINYNNVISITKADKEVELKYREWISCEQVVGYPQYEVLDHTHPFKVEEEDESVA